MEFAAFSTQIDRGPIGPVYLLAGAEDFLIDAGVAQLRQRFFPQGPDDFNFDLFDGQGLDADRVLTAAATLPLLAPRRLVIVRRIDAMDAAALARLADYLAAPVPETCLVLTAAKIDRRRELYAALVRMNAWVDCSPLPPRQLPGWIRARAQTLGLELADDAIAYLAERGGGGLTGLATELTKLSTAAGSAARLDLERVIALCGGPVGASVFDWIRAIGERKPGPALVILDRLLDAGDVPLQLLGFLARQFRQFWIAQALLRQGQTEPDLMRELGVPRFAAGAIARQARGYREDELRWALGRLAETDAGLKGAALAPRLMLELLVIDLCLGPKAGLRRFLGGERFLYLERQA